MPLPDVRLIDIALVEQLHAPIRDVADIEDGVLRDLALDIDIPLLYVSILQVKVEDIGDSIGTCIRQSQHGSQRLNGQRQRGEADIASGSRIGKQSGVLRETRRSAVY